VRRLALSLAALTAVVVGGIALASDPGGHVQNARDLLAQADAELQAAIAEPLPTVTTTAPPVTTTVVVTTTVAATPPPPDPSCTGHQVPPGSGLKAAMDATPGGTFCLEPGTYTVPQTITAQDGDEVIGAGRDQTFIVGAGAENLFTATGPAVWGFSHLDISGAVGNPNVCGADCGRAFIGNGDSLTITDVRCHDNQNQCVGSGSADLHFIGNECDHNGNAAFAAATAKSTACIKRVRGGDSDITTEVRDSFIHDNIWNGLWFDFYEGVAIVEGNVITGNGKAGIQYEVSGGWNARDNAVFRGNTIQDNGLTGISTIGGGVICNTCADLLAELNIFGGNFQHLAFKFLTTSRAWGDIHGVVIRNNTPLNGDTIACPSGNTCTGNS
jgi:hypothetical protein